MSLKLLLILIGVAGCYCHSESHEEHKSVMKEKFSWRLLDFQFPNVTARSNAIATKSYIPTNNNICSFAVWKDKIFVSIFRHRTGVVSSLNYFSAKCKTKSPLLIPYPSFDANYVNEDPLQRTTTLPCNSSVISGGYFKIDKCDRLWIIDSGVVDYYGTPRTIANASLVIFDLKKNKMVRRREIPAKLVNQNSVYGALILDSHDENCHKSFAYIADMFRSIIVYSFKEDRFWAVQHNYLGSDPRGGNFFYEGLNFQWNFGVFALSLGGKRHDGSRRVYVSSFSATTMYYVSNRVLQNETYIGLKNYYYDFIYLGDRGEFGQVFALAYDTKSHVLFDAEVGRGQIGCWNSKSPYNSTNFGVVYKNTKKFFPADIAIDSKRNLWVLSDRLPVYLFGAPLTEDIKNIKIYKQKVKDAISGTICDPDDYYRNYKFLKSQLSIQNN